MSEQRGLRNPDTHGTTSDGEPYCESCGVCDEGWRCRCCLAAEVEALREERDALKHDYDKVAAQVQRVRDVCKTHHMDDSYPKRRNVVFLDRILRILDGGDA